MTERYDLFSQTKEELCHLAEALGEKPFRGKQIFSWLYNGAETFDDMTNLSKKFRNLLEGRCRMQLPVIAKKQESKDGTKKYLFPGADTFVESAYIPDRERATLCVSSHNRCKVSASVVTSPFGNVMP